jgi:hypothetical protein
MLARSLSAVAQSVFFYVVKHAVVSSPFEFFELPLGIMLLQKPHPDFGRRTRGCGVNSRACRRVALQAVNWRVVDGNDMARVLLKC